MPRPTTARAHPLNSFVEKINAEESYSLRQIAGIMELAQQSAVPLLTHGWLPGARTRPLPHGGREHYWRGSQLIRLAKRPIKITFDHEKYSPTTLYRAGCRCPVCTAAHTAADGERKRALREDLFPEKKRRRLLSLVTGGTTVKDAAKALEMSHVQVYGRATWDAEFGQQLDEAAWGLCRFGPSSEYCGTGGAYRGNTAHENVAPCRGTGCREWRRDSSMRERAEK